MVGSLFSKPVSVRRAVALVLVFSCASVDVAMAATSGSAGSYRAHNVEASPAEGESEQSASAHARDIASARGVESTRVVPDVGKAPTPLPIDGRAVPAPDAKTVDKAPKQLPKAAEPPTVPKDDVATNPPTRKAVTGFDPRKSVELPGKRDAFSTTYSNPDGTETVEMSSMPVHYKDPKGAWLNIDNRVVADGKGGLTNTANEWSVVFGQMVPGQGVAMVMPEGTVRFVADNAKPIMPTVEPDGVSVRYTEVFPGTDLVYKVTGAGVEELLIVKSASATALVSFSMDGVQFDTKPGERLGRGSDAAQRVRISQPESFDAKGRPVELANQVFTTVDAGTGRSIVSVGLTPEFVRSAPADAFPLTVDPSVSVTIGQSWVHSFGNYSNGTVYGSYNGGYVRVGNPYLSSTSTVRWRSTALFDYSAYSGASVVSAQVNTTVVDGTTNGNRSLYVYWADQDSFASNGRWYPQTEPPGAGYQVSASTYVSSAISSGSASHGTTDLARLYNNFTRLPAGGGVLLFKGDEAAAYTYKKFMVSLTLTVNRWPSPPTLTSVSSAGRTISWTGANATDADNDSLLYYYRVFQDLNGSNGPDAGEPMYDLGWTSATAGSMTVPAATFAGKPNVKFGVYSYDQVFNLGESHVNYSYITQWAVPNTLPPAAPTSTAISTRTPPTLTPTLPSVAVTDPDGDPVYYVYFVCPAGKDPNNNPNDCKTSGWTLTQQWTIPAGQPASGGPAFPRWNEPYTWWVGTTDSTFTGSNWAADTFIPTMTAVAVPAVGGGFNPYSDTTVGVDAANGNFHYATTDVKVPGLATGLSIDRSMNTLLTSTTNGAFGRGWTVPFDMKVRPDPAGNAFVLGADGGEEFHGKNPDGLYSASLGGANTLTKDGAGWHLTELSGTIYDFDPTTGNLLKATDKAGHVLQSTWTGGTVQELKDVASGRTLTLTYTTPSGADRSHVSQVATANVAAHGGALVWKYYYTGDLLTAACNPVNNASTGICERYGYDTSNRLTTVTGVRGNVFATLTYDTSTACSPARTPLPTRGRSTGGSPIRPSRHLCRHHRLHWRRSRFVAPPSPTLCFESRRLISTRRVG